MRPKGRTVWVPAAVVIEVEDIIREDNLVGSKADGFKELVKYCRVGREVNRLRRFDFSKKVELPKVGIDTKKKRKSFMPDYLEGVL